MLSAEVIAKLKSDTVTKDRETQKYESLEGVYEEELAAKALEDEASDEESTTAAPTTEAHEDAETPALAVVEPTPPTHAPVFSTPVPVVAPVAPTPPTVAPVQPIAPALVVAPTVVVAPTPPTVAPVEATPYAY